CGGNGTDSLVVQTLEKGSHTDFELPLYPCFTPFPVVGLRFVVVGHHFDELLRQHRVLRFADAKVGAHHRRLFQLFDVLFHHCEMGGPNRQPWRSSSHTTPLPFSFPRTRLAVLLMSAIRSSSCCLTSVARIVV